MIRTTEQTTKEGQMERLAALAEKAPDAYRFAFAFLIGIGTVDDDVRDTVDRAIEYVERTYGND